MDTPVFNPPREMKAFAPAKINWTLEVLARREDGYHEIRTTLQAIDLHDELEFLPAPQLALETASNHASPEEDLALQAAGLLQKPGCGASIRLEKRIPAATGLGGGSSDAAATLRALNRLWSLGLSDSTLCDHAARLGSDVPFFLHGGGALAQGRGELVQPLPDTPARWLVLVSPPLRLGNKTAAMYEALTPAAYTDGARTTELAHWLRAGGGINETHIYNAFESVAFTVFPTLSAYKLALEAAARTAAYLAGSGPTLFALMESEQAARAAQIRLRSGDAHVTVARTLTRAESLRIIP